MGYISTGHLKNFNVDRIEAALSMSRSSSPINDQVDFTPNFSNGIFAKKVVLEDDHPVDDDTDLEGDDEISYGEEYLSIED